ncbi:hypothetical protein GWK48_03425 [Metallosphaera tengchongensis]|uniref:Uncharacterized protein n=1 Tax=Metallosphaera tengchongensis TaxID=1532350 RepID=A0A6N0NWR3_9CREN|nr:hypothetical protein [Metallosphaera tengchongensis]QKQ99569.1 hypothetical protein GWK48_03425 [Metallosphaera tengchongensis]
MESFINCLGKIVDLSRTSDLQWSFKLRETILLTGTVELNPGMVTELIIRFRNPEGMGTIRVAQGRILEVSYEGILALVLRPKLRECSQIIAASNRKGTYS